MALMLAYMEFQAQALAFSLLWNQQLNMVSDWLWTEAPRSTAISAQVRSGSQHYHVLTYQRAHTLRSSSLTINIDPVHLCISLPGR